MKWNFHPIKLPFFILILLQEIDGTCLPNGPSKHDIKKVLNNIFTKIFKDVNWIEKLESMSGIEKMDYHYLELPTENSFSMFGDKVVVKLGVETIIPSYIKIRWDFLKNQLNMSHDKMTFFIYGEVKEKPNSDNTLYIVRATSLTLKNYSINAEKLSTNQESDEKIRIDLSYDHVTNEMGISESNLRGTKLSYEEQLELIHILSLSFESALRDAIINRTDFVDLLNTMFNVNPRQIITSVDPDFPLNPHNYYYLIPEMPIIHTSFKNIKIIGMWDFEPFYFDEETATNTNFTLITKNIRGNMNLDTGFEQWPQFGLNFTIDELSIRAENNTKSIRSIFEEISESSRTISSWLAEFSTFIIELLESAIESSIMPDKCRSSFSPLSIREMETALIELLKTFPKTVS
ncbi:uncharacterized protein LOC135848831 isoform X2 [Planococcus citri]|uniref:uncharacterized protein LOC135848831 isoform X2 n=1 Tax=Planococcus citri TaxID=170843 RepID=UPI0031FA1A00